MFCMHMDGLNKDAVCRFRELVTVARQAIGMPAHLIFDVASVVSGYIEHNSVWARIIGEYAREVRELVARQRKSV